MSECVFQLPFLRLFFKRLVMASSYRSFSLLSSSFERTHFEPSEVRDVGCSNQAVDLVSRLSFYPNCEWVDSRVLDIPTCFRGLFALDGSLSKVSMLKPDSPLDMVAADRCNYIDRI